MRQKVIAVKKTEVKEDTTQKITSICPLCEKEFTSIPMYYFQGIPVCSWKCLYNKKIKKVYKKLKNQPIVIEKKKGRPSGPKSEQKQEKKSQKHHTKQRQK